MALRALVVDDSLLFRRVLADALSSLPNVEVVASAPNGRIALEKLRALRPDFLTLDIEMPEMDGLSVLDQMRRQGDRAEVIMVSALSRRGGEMTVRALEKGALDFILKPEAASAEENRLLLIRELTPIVRALAHRLEIRSILRDASAPRSPASPTRLLTSVARERNRSRPEMVLIGVSTGGPVALSQLLPAMPANLGVPIFIVQHMPPIFTRALADDLAPKCVLSVREASNAETALPNRIYIAPGGRQMRLTPTVEGPPKIQITDDPPENNCRPSVDYLFRSAAAHFPGRSLAVILTGMGSDGTLGLRELKQHGCNVIAQDEASCVIYGMPKAAVEAGLADMVLPLYAIAGAISTAVQGIRA